MKKKIEIKDLIFYKCLKCGSDDVGFAIHKDEIILECIDCGYALTISEDQKIEVEENDTRITKRIWRT